MKLNFQSKTILKSPKQAGKQVYRLLSRGSGDVFGQGCDDVLAGSSTTKHDSPFSLSEVIKSGFDTFGRGILVFYLQACESKCTLVHL